MRGASRRHAREARNNVDAGETPARGHDIALSNRRACVHNRPRGKISGEARHDGADANWRASSRAGLPVRRGGGAGGPRVQQHAGGERPDCLLGKRRERHRYRPYEPRHRDIGRHRARSRRQAYDHRHGQDRHRSDGRLHLRNGRHGLPDPAAGHRRSFRRPERGRRSHGGQPRRLRRGRKHREHSDTLHRRGGRIGFHDRRRGRLRPLLGHRRNRCRSGGRDRLHGGCWRRRLAYGRGQNRSRYRYNARLHLDDGQERPRRLRRCQDR